MMSGAGGALYRRRFAPIRLPCKILQYYRLETNNFSTFVYRSVVSSEVVEFAKHGSRFFPC